MYLKLESTQLLSFYFFRCLTHNGYRVCLHEFLNQTSLSCFSLRLVNKAGLHSVPHAQYISIILPTPTLHTVPFTVFQKWLLDRNGLQIRYFLIPPPCINAGMCTKGRFIYTNSQTQLLKLTDLQDLRLTNRIEGSIPLCLSHIYHLFESKTINN